MKRVNILLSVIILMALSCAKKEEKLPILGRSQLVEKEVDGQTVLDTIPHTIADFKFLNQDSSWVTNETFNGKIYVADFFFTSCHLSVQS